MALSRPFKEDRLTLPLSTPLSSTYCQAVPTVSRSCRHSRARSEKVGHGYTHFCDTNSEFHIVPAETFRVSNRWVTSLAIEVPATVSHMHATGCTDDSGQKRVHLLHSAGEEVKDIVLQRPLC